MRKEFSSSSSSLSSSSRRFFSNSVVLNCDEGKVNPVLETVIFLRFAVPSRGVIKAA